MSGYADRRRVEVPGDVVAIVVRSADGHEVLVDHIDGSVVAYDGKRVTLVSPRATSDDLRAMVEATVRVVEREGPPPKAVPRDPVPLAAAPPRLPADQLQIIHATLDALYSEHGAGCCLHIVTDDANHSDSSVDFCIGWAVEHGHPACEAIARLLRLIPEHERGGFIQQTGMWAWEGT